MRDNMEFDTTPYGVDCVQLGDPEYRNKVQLEYNKMVQLLNKKLGDPRDYNCSFKLKANSHDFGTYHSFAVYYEDTCPKAVGYIMALEDNWPEDWDDDAKVDIQLAELEEAEEVYY